MQTSNQRIIIGLCGRAQHGKSSLSHAMIEHLNRQGRNAHNTSFATTPKTMLRIMGFDSEQLYGGAKGTPTALAGGKTPRFAMQSLATEWGRKMLYDEIWVDAWQRNLERLAPDTFIIVDDVRHGPEIERILALGGFLVEVYRPALMPKTTLGWLKHYVKQFFAHSSEKLDFAKYGIPRLIVEEGQTDKTLQKLLAAYPELQ